MKAGVFPPPSIISIQTRKSTWKDRVSSSHRSRLIGSAGNGRPRRLQVNAFGFGGSNYVVQLEQAMDEQLRSGIPERGLVSPESEGFD